MPDGEFGEKHAAALFADDCEQSCGGSPVFGVLFVPGQAGHMLDRIAQRHKWLALTWQRYRLVEL
jgi:hypothetical protein